MTHTLIGPDYFQEALDYLERHQLYEEGLTIWKGTEQYQVSPSTMSLKSMRLI